MSGHNVGLWVLRSGFLVVWDNHDGLWTGSSVLVYATTGCGRSVLSYSARLVSVVENVILEEATLACLSPGICVIQTRAQEHRLQQRTGARIRDQTHSRTHSTTANKRGFCLTAS